MVQASSRSIALGVIAGVFAVIGILCLLYAGVCWFYIAPAAGHISADSLRAQVQAKHTAGVFVDQMVLAHEERLAQAEDAVRRDSTQRLAAVCLFGGCICLIPLAFTLRRS